MFLQNLTFPELMLFCGPAAISLWLGMVLGTWGFQRMRENTVTLIVFTFMWAGAMLAVGTGWLPIPTFPKNSAAASWSGWAGLFFLFLGYYAGTLLRRRR